MADPKVVPGLPTGEIVKNVVGGSTLGPEVQGASASKPEKGAPK